MVKLEDMSVNWEEKMGNFVAFSTCEAMYLAILEASKTVIWMRHALNKINNQVEDPTQLNAWNNFAHSKAIGKKNKIKRSKHIDIRFRFLFDFFLARKCD